MDAGLAFVFSLLFLLWLMIFGVAGFFVYKLRTRGFFKLRVPGLMIFTQFFGFGSSIIVAASLIVDPVTQGASSVFCVPVNIIYSLAGPICILPLSQLMIDLVIRSDLTNQMKNDQVTWERHLRILNKVTTRVIIMIFFMAIHLAINFSLQNTWSNNCQLSSVIPFVISMGIYLVPVFLFGFKFKQIEDPFSVRKEIGISIVVHLPTVVMIILTILDLWSITFAHIYLYFTITVFVTNFIFPFIMFHKYGSHVRAAQNPKFDIVYFLDADKERTIELCCGQFATENILFYQEVKVFQRGPSFEKAQKIFTQYIESGCKFQVNLEYSVVKRISAIIKSGAHENTMFDVALTAVVKMLNEDVVPHLINEMKTIGSSESKLLIKAESLMYEGAFPHNMEMV
jgi:hypothetical protein